MQKCLKCKMTFSYKQVMKSGFIGYRSIECNTCNKWYQVTFNSRLRVTFGIMLIPLLNVLDLLDQSTINIVFLNIVVGTIVITISPYLIRYKAQNRLEEQ